MTSTELNDADEFAAGAAADNNLSFADLGQLVVEAIYAGGGDVEKAIKTLERITITLSPCQLGAEAAEVFAGAIETLDNIRGFDIKRGFSK